MVFKRLVLLSCIAMIVGIIATPAAFAGDMITIMADQSCRTTKTVGDDNVSNSAKLSIRSDASAQKSWIKFDISELDVSSLESATLTVTMHEAKSGTRNFDISYVNDDCRDNIDWDETNLTWNNAPGNATDSQTDLDPSKTTLVTTVNFVDGVPGMTHTVDILEALESDTDGIFQIVLHNSNGYMNMSTHDHPEEAYRPFLSVTAGPKGNAKKPYPANGATDVVLTPVLHWTPGAFVEGLSPKHKIFFSANVNDVNDGIGGVTQDANDYAPGSPLDFITTYYWRVDEANSVSGWDPGELWSFTVEPEGYPLAEENITATVSSQSPDQGPEKTIDRSGLDADDLHSNEPTDMWLSEASEPNEAWIQYEFDKPYKLHQMLVWNYNGPSFLSGLGLKDVTIAYSTDGVDWIQINDVFAQAPGTEGYAPNMSVEFGGVAAKKIKITANSNWGNNPLLDQYGLSEVMFLYIPVDAREPDPEDEASGVDIDVTLGWRAGREAAEHNVYLSKDLQVVIDGTAPVVTVPATSYGPLSLDLGSMYYWRVDEVNNAEALTTWQGGTWSFTTKEYLVVEDFESYNDIPEGDEGSNLVYLTWIDGFDNPSTNGSTMGYVTGSSLETDIVHGGRQSVPVSYDNTSASLSEVTVSTNDLAIGSDWTKGSPEQLTFWFYGDPNNTGTDQMYVKVNGVKVTYDGVLTQAEWQEFPIDLASLGINLSNVTTLTIGFERIGATGGSGMVFIDDIWLYRPAAAQ